MRKFFLPLILFVSALTYSLYAESGFPVPYWDGDRCGYSDHEMNIIVKPQFDACGPFEYGTAPVLKKGRYGLIGRDGKVILQAQYSSFTSLGSGFAVIELKGRHALINSMGETVIPFSVYSIESFSGGVAVISKGGKFGLMDKGGNILLPAEYEKIEPGGKSLFIVAAKASRGDYNNEEFRLYRPSAATMSPECYERLMPAANGFMIFKKDDGWGYLNSEGAVIAPAVYEGVKDIKSDGSALIKKRGKWGVMNGRGKIIVAVQYDEAGGGEGPGDERSRAAENFFRVMSGGRWGIITLTGEIKVPLEYKFIGCGESGYFPALRDVYDKKRRIKKTGLTLLDRSGWELFEPDSGYNVAGGDGEGLLAAGIVTAQGRGRLMGYVNHLGEPVISPEYDDAAPFSGGFAIVKKNGLCGMINRGGRLVEEVKYDDISRSAHYPGLYQGIINGRKVFFEPGGRHFFK